MALNVGELEATLKLKDQMSAELKTIEKHTNTFSDSVKRIGVVIAAAFTAQKIVQFGMESVKAYSEQENALVKLEAALKSQGRYTPELAKQYEDLGGSFQQSTIYADEMVQGMEALLIQVGNVAPEAMKGALTSATNLAAGLGIDLRAATMLVGKAFAGETGSLSRYGIIVDDTAKKTESAAVATTKAIDAAFGGQAQAAAGTFSGQLAQLNNTWGDFKEVVGKILIDLMLPMLPALKMAATWMQGLGSAVEIARGYFNSFVAAGFSTLKFLADAQIKVLSLTNAFGINDKMIASLKQTSFEYGEMAKAVTATQVRAAAATTATSAAGKVRVMVSKDEVRAVDNVRVATENATRAQADAKNIFGGTTTINRTLQTSYQDLSFVVDNYGSHLDRMTSEASAYLREHRDEIQDAANAMGNLTSTIVTQAAIVVPTIQGMERETSAAWTKITASWEGFKKGLTGGGGIQGFFDNLGAGVVQGLGNILSGGISSIIDVGLQQAMKGLVWLGGKIAEWFGGWTRERLARLDAEIREYRERTGFEGPIGSPVPSEESGFQNPEAPSQDTSGFASGTLGRTGSFFKNFGAGTATVLHGTEAVVRPDQAGAFARQYGGDSRLDAILSELTLQRSLMPLAIRDALARA